MDKTDGFQARLEELAERQAAMDERLNETVAKAERSYYAMQEWLRMLAQVGAALAKLDGLADIEPPTDLELAAMRGEVQATWAELKAERERVRSERHGGGSVAPPARTRS